MEITVLHNQSLLDIAIQHTGSVENTFAIAVANGLTISDILTVGRSLLIPTNTINDNDILYYYYIKKIEPATGINKNRKIDDGDIDADEGMGISFWSINYNFIVQKNDEVVIEK